MSAAMQLRLLRVLQEGEIRPVGATTNRRVNVRVIAATNADLEAEIRAGRFRQDLFYRLNVFPITLPPLRERADDIPALAEHFARVAAAKARRTVPGLTTEALRALRAYPFPGNVRELENEIERAVMLADDGQPAGVEQLSDRVRHGAVRESGGHTLNEAIEQLKRRMIEDALRECGTVTAAAERLGLTRQNLQQMLRRRGI
jgi:transcriptional regulator with PAS, ATPase and Fis domain